MKIREKYSDIPEFFKDYLRNFIQYLKKRLDEDLISLILYGSVARESWNKDSDIDLHLILSNKFFKMYDKSKISEFTISYYYKIYDTKLYDTMKFHPFSILSLSVKELKRFRTLFYDIALDGIIIYDTNNIGLELIKKYKKRIEEKDLKRVFIDKDDFYWKRGDIKMGDIVEL